MLGGAGGVRLTATSSKSSDHRLNLRQRLGLGKTEVLERPSFDGEVLALPGSIDCFPDTELNELLYRWLTAWFAHAPNPDGGRSEDPLHSDLGTLQTAIAASARAIDAWPGLAKTHERLCAAVRDIRPRRPLDGWEAAVEEAIVCVLGGEAPAGIRGQQVFEAIVDPSRDLDAFTASADYRPYLPVPLWGDLVRRAAAGPRSPDDEHASGGRDADDRRRQASRRPGDQLERRDSLIFNRFEYLLSIAEMLNLNRDVDDDDPDAARKAADSVEKISVSDHDRKSASRLRLDLELAPPAVATEPVTAEFTYPEWDYSRQVYHENHCRVVARIADEEGEQWEPDEAARRRIRAVRRQFEALRPRRRMLAGQNDGDELDLSALIRSIADVRSGQPGTDRIYRKAHSAERDLSVALLVDVSLSTDSWIDNRRVLDVEKEAVLALAHGLAACGDDHAIFAFTSNQRRSVSVSTLKGFDEPLNESVRRRIQALRPGHYTRIGAALRHVTKSLLDRPNRHRLLIIVTDGKPNDADHYEGRYGVEDTRRAVREARRTGLAVFGITVDRKARDYFPYLFGRGGFAIAPRIGKLPDALPAIYRQITCD